MLTQATRVSLTFVLKLAPLWSNPHIPHKNSIRSIALLYVIQAYVIYTLFLGNLLIVNIPLEIRGLMFLKILRRWGRGGCYLDKFLMTHKDNIFFPSIEKEKIFDEGKDLVRRLSKMFVNNSNFVILNGFKRTYSILKCLS